MNRGDASFDCTFVGDLVVLVRPGGDTMRIVGLCGFAGVGKDTAYANLPEKHLWTRHAFADPLKADITQLPGMAGIDLANPTQKAKARPLLVAYGATVRAFYPDYWVDRTLHEVRKAHRNTIITDVRYLNEIRTILEFDGMVIRVERPGYGPANEEESMSFRLIEKSNLCLPVLLNCDTPAVLGERLSILLQKVI